MTMEAEPEVEQDFLTPNDFLADVLARAGVDRVEVLTPQDKACALIAYHNMRCEAGQAQLAHLPLSEEQRWRIWTLIVEHNVMMRTVGELLMGHRFAIEDNRRLEELFGNWVK